MFWERAVAEVAKHHIDVPSGPPGRHRRVLQRVYSGSSEHRFTTCKITTGLLSAFQLLTISCKKWKEGSVEKLLKPLMELQPWILETNLGLTQKKSLFQVSLLISRVFQN